MGLVAASGVKLRGREAAEWNLPKKGVGHVKARSPYTGAGEVSIRKDGPIKVCIAEVLASEHAALKKIVVEADAAQVAGLVAGRRVQLRKSEARTKCVVRIGDVPS